MKRTNLLILIFFIGFSSLIYEIYSTRILFLFFTETSYAVTIAITAFLAGIAFSSLFFSSFIKKKNANPITVIWIMQILIAFYGYFFLKHYDLIPHLIDLFVFKSPGITYLIKILIIWLFLFIPAFFIGGSFPLVNGLFINKESKDPKITHDTSLVYFWDTAGAIFGGLVTGFYLLPHLGFEWTITIGVLINLTISIVIAPKKIFRIFSFILLIFVLLISIYGNTPKTKSTQYKKNILTTYPELSKRFGDILFQEKSPYGVITIGKNASGRPGNKSLFINYRDMCASGYHISESLLGKLIKPALQVDSRVLNIGLGCGFTANAIAQAPNVAHLDIVEINPVVAKGTRQQFAEENHHVLELKKTNLMIADGADYVRNTKNIYNAIVIDIEEPTVIYSSPLYTDEYFRIMKGRLQNGGILALWTPSGSEKYEKIIYNTLKNNFKNVYIRSVGSFYVYFGTDAEYNISATDRDEIGRVDQILNAQITDINTLDNRALERYFNIHFYFGLPTDYKEKFIEEVK